MVQAWYMNEEPYDKREEHHKNPPEFVPLDDLFKLTGVEYYKLDINNLKSDETLENIKKERGYTYEDQITISPEHLPNYEEKLKIFYSEHIHTDEEIRLCVEGSGYFDVRDKNDSWIRVLVIPGDLLIVPAGIYHRFTLDTKNYIIARRFFVGEPVWTPYNRPADDMAARKEYVEKLNSGTFTKVN
ncbi:acireductone dioxygenase-like [Rhynchophorus ferrugineus]|uniref:acireductone dioxygenase-like n=1 Tax=Rhynchophorus ferrugineus TaxID=354439 RepID=UPI003FCDAEB3